MQKNSWVLLVVVIALGLGYAVIRTSPRPVPARHAGDLPEWVKAIRRGDDADVQGPESIKSWLDARLTKGVTSRREVTSIFIDRRANSTRRPLSLDRPERDETDVWQLTLWESAEDSAYLVFHFDSQTGVLADWDFHQAICGFCPHIFAHDGDWRLEGKMLAGCIGRDRAGTDTLVLPRLKAENGACNVMLANLAPEIDYVRKVRLAAVPIDAGEELDVDASGGLVVWRPLDERRVVLENGPKGTDAVSIHRDGSIDADVIVLELRNTGEFELAIRNSILKDETDGRDTQLTVDRGTESVRIPPVGTKFLRRVALALPASVGEIRLTCSSGFWRVPRVWLGKRSVGVESISWISPVNDRPLVLKPMQSAPLEFVLPEQNGSMAYLLRVSGYYEFVGLEHLRVEF